MNILFAIQSEGRGHLTQAIALKHILDRAGHRVVGVMLGGGEHRNAPGFFIDEFEDSEIGHYRSPHFAINGDRSISPSKTGLNLLRNLGAYRQSYRALKYAIERLKPDLLINFYEPIAGMVRLLNPDLVPSIAIGHQFMLGHPSYVRNEQHYLQRRMMLAFNRVIGARSIKAGLSFYEAEDMSRQSIYCCPPLLRDHLFELSTTRDEGFLLVYLLNHGYGRDIINWHALHPDQRIECFCENPEPLQKLAVNRRLRFKGLDGKRFLDMMERCSGVVCTAGFETVSEAAWLGKPLMMVPVENHVEQELNAMDAERLGLGLHARRFDLDRVLKFSPGGTADTFRRWVGKAESRILRLVNLAARHSHRETPGLMETQADEKREAMASV